MAQITYANKSDINTTATPATNKVTSADMNEIKSVVNTNDSNVGAVANLTTTDKTSVVNAINEINQRQITTDGSEVKTGRVIDGYVEYIKRITLLSFPGNNSEKTWATGINMTNIVVTSVNVMVKSNSANWFQIPNIDTADARASLNSDGSIHIYCFQGNLSGTNGYAEITYYHTS